MFAYLDASDDVVAASTSEYTLVDAQALIPSITTVIANAPLGLVAKGEVQADRPPYWHRLTSGDGTSFGDYTELPTYGQYTYSVIGDTANGVVSTERLTIEIQKSAIATPLTLVVSKSGVLLVWFDTALSVGDETILDGLIAAHDGVEVRDFVSVSVDPNPEPVVPGSSKVVANDRPAVEVATGVTGWAAAWGVWPLEQFSHAEMCVCISFILKEAGTGSNVRVCARVKAHGAGADSSTAFTDTQFVAVPVTHTTVGEVFRGVIELDASTFQNGDSLAIQLGRDGANTLGAGTNDDVSVAIQVISINIRGR